MIFTSHRCPCDRLKGIKFRGAVCPSCRQPANYQKSEDQQLYRWLYYRSGTPEKRERQRLHADYVRSCYAS